MMRLKTGGPGSLRLKDTLLHRRLCWHTTDLAITPLSLELEVMPRHLVIRAPLHLGYVLLVCLHTNRHRKSGWVGICTSWAPLLRLLVGAKANQTSSPMCTSALGLSIKSKYRDSASNQFVPKHHRWALPWWAAMSLMLVATLPVLNRHKVLTISILDRLKSFNRPTLSITARCTGFNTFILSVMPYTISYFGLTTADLNRLRQAAARFILKRHWLSPFHSRSSHSFWGFVLLFVFLCVCLVGWFWCCFVFLVLFPPTMLRSSSCLPKLTTVRAVMVRAAMEEKKNSETALARSRNPSICPEILRHSNPP